MKVLLFVSDAQDADLLISALEECGHIIAAVVLDPQSLTYLTARQTPHFIVAESQYYDVSSKVLASFESIFPDVAVLRCDIGVNGWEAKLGEALNCSLSLPKPRSYAQGPRVVYHAAELLKVSAGKLRRPRFDTPDWQHLSRQQEARFVVQLQAGRQNHVAALHYYRCLRAQQAGLDREISYRVLHGSYKGLWARDLAARWLALLCHYVPGVELAYLPLPMTPGPAVDFIHSEMADEGLYAITLLLYLGINPEIASEIKALGATRFGQQSNSELLQLCLRLFGLSRLLAQVGTAQVRLISRWLDPNRATNDAGSRGNERYLGILRDFYGFSYVFHAPHPLHDTLTGFHAGTTYVPHPPRVPTFQEWKRIFQASQF